MEALFTIEQFTTCSKRQAAEIDSLIQQLGPRYPHTVTKSLLIDLISIPGNTLLAASDGHGRIHGILLLTTLHAVTGNKVWIEDFVVDQQSRGQGVGNQLLDHAVSYAQDHGVTHINLTARATRAAARKLYLSAGFKPHDTDYFRLTLTSSQVKAA